MPPPTHRRMAEIVFAALLALFSAFMLWTAWGISGFSSLVSAGAFPMLTTTVMLVCALVLTGRAWRGTGANAAPGAEAETSPGPVLPACLPLVVAAIAVYLWLLERAGFILASFLFLVATMHLLGSRRFVRNLLVAAVGLALIVLVFESVFSVALPRGSWLPRIGS